MLGKVSYQGGHSFLFSGCQMMHVVTEKQNGGGGGGVGTNILERVTEPAIIQFALFIMGHLIVY